MSVSISANSQQFEVINAGIVGVGRSSVSWADYDKDGDLDILVTGNTGSGPYVAAIYRNDLGSFININAGLTGIDNSSVAWGDYDNDGDPDILATGEVQEVQIPGCIEMITGSLFP
ncbi:MAG: VCBS repeat-containing protein [Bacteroidales bacterium]|nr:VCBS repeat-containing protein [Bacteroidales bacterium]